MKHAAPYGSWKSPITPEFVSGKDRVLTASVQTDGEDIYFIESRPDEQGRSVLMVRRADGALDEVLPKEFSVRTRYLEYSGSSFLVHKGEIYFVNFADQEIYRAKPGQPPVQLTGEKTNRFADFTMDERRGRLIALREVPAQPQSRNSICAVDLKTGAVEDLITGSDFYNCTRLNGDSLLWISWDHPNMAWNGTELWTAPLSDLKACKKIAGNKEQAVCQAQWHGDEIYFIAEMTNFSNLYRTRNGKIENVFPRESEFAFPDWVPGNQQYAIGNDGTVCANYCVQGMWQIIKGKDDKSARLIGQPKTAVATILPYKDGMLILHGDPLRAGALKYLNEKNEMTEIYSSKSAALSPEYISVAEETKYSTADGGTGYGWLYLPKNPEFMGMPGEKPPLIVFAHGGPTAMSFSNFRKEIQFWTSRGYAIVDVNYGGSTGYGRAYRERLRNNWGLVDVADCVAAVKGLSAKGLIDPKRVAIRGGSAGGYTTLAALAFTKGVFAVGASYFGVSELELLAKETHKLESKYLDQLVGPYPQAIAVYKERAPIEHVDQFNCPIIFFQGDEDKVVPPNQSELMHESLKKKGIATDYHLYEKEGHGFRRAENMQHSLKAEHGFYARFFGFPVQPGDRIV